MLGEEGEGGGREKRAEGAEGEAEEAERRGRGKEEILQNFWSQSETALRLDDCLPLCPLCMLGGRRGKREEEGKGKGKREEKGKGIL
jgi:hypothetical protein